MCPHGSLCVLIVPYASLWVIIGLFAFLWVIMGHTRIIRTHIDVLGCIKTYEDP